MSQTASISWLYIRKCSVLERIEFRLYSPPPPPPLSTSPPFTHSLSERSQAANFCSVKGVGQSCSVSFAFPATPPPPPPSPHTHLSDGRSISLVLFFSFLFFFLLSVNSVVLFQSQLPSVCSTVQNSRFGKRILEALSLKRSVCSRPGKNVTGLSSCRDEEDASVVSSNPGKDNAN